MRQKHSLTYRIFSIVLSFAVVLPGTLALIGDSGSAQAITSLPYVEELKQNSSKFNILEIVPQAGQGSIGYYIDGQEPCADWAKSAAKTANAHDKASRKAYVDDFFAKLTAAGILGTGNTTPLEVGSSYTEVYPWEDHTSDYTKLTLENLETVNVTGTFKLAENGAYKQSQDFTFVSNGEGKYVQVIDYFSKKPADQSGAKYYYDPTFTLITDNSTVAIGTAVYSKSEEVFTYEGTVGASNFPGMEIGEKYYSVESYGAPSETQGASDYVAVSSAYTPKDTDEAGYFNAVNLKYTYIGAGGTHNFEYSASGESNTIEYNTVYYKGGFTNNNWFLRYVLDWSPENGEKKPDISFTVKSVVGSDVTATDVSLATLVVLSSGFVPGGTPTLYSDANDISTAVSSAITAEVEQTNPADTNYNLPVIVDNRLLSSNSGAPNLKALATNLKGTNSNNSFVKNSIFFFDSDAVRTALATKEFRTFYTPSSTYTVSGSAYYPAYEEIVYENFLRTTKNASAVTLEEKVNIARAIRYIMNFAGKRIITPKTAVNVLEIQPGSGSQLTADIVKNWLGYPSGSTAIGVHIDTMSTAELIGKIDVISENYDIVYIGSKVQGFNPTNLNSTNYNDNNMDGLIYSSIGDSVVMNSSGFTMSGLLDRDYAASTFTKNGITYNKLNTSSNTARTFRYSGNDLTKTKMQELVDFINSGYPVIISDDLASGQRHPATEAVTFTANVTGVQSGTSAILTASATAAAGQEIPSFFTPTYQWYSNDLNHPLSGQTSSTYTSSSSGTFLCTISYTVNGTTYTATSNKITLTPKTGYTYTETNNGYSGTYQTHTNYTLYLSRLNNTYTVAVTPVKSGISYQWQGRNGFGSWKNIDGAINDTMTNSSYTYYRCEVIIDNVQGNYTNYLSTSSSSTTNLITITTSVTYNALVTPTVNTDDVTLTCDDVPDIGVAEFNWYKKNIFGGYSYYSTDSSITVTSGTYYCRATMGSTYAASNDYTISSDVVGYNIANGAVGTSATIPAQSASSFSINGTTVDNSSYMYELLANKNSKPNFMAQSELASAENQDKLKKYVNLSKPEIVFSSNAPNHEPYPTEYSNNNGVVTSLSAKSDGTYCLEYYLSVKNNTDTDPAKTRYTCNLYVDTNGDGRYSDGERLGDIVVREWNSASNTVGAIISTSELKGDKEYYVSRTMPSDKYGIIPWKLEIIKSGTGNAATHTSVHKYTHIPTAIGKQVKLDILQINASGGLSLAAQMQPGSAFYSSVTGQSYAGIYGKLLADISRDFNVSITTVLTSDVNPSSGKTWTHGTTTYTDLVDYLKSYDMLIIGFKDSYDGISQASAAAITAYIDTGKAILFTHDNTSFFNMPFNNYQTTTSTVNTGFGYYFNMTIRDAVGLDRYGVTDPKYGISTYAPPEIVRASDRTGWTAMSYAGATAANLTELINNGYSVAYQPKTSRGGTIPETQGFARGVLDRYKGSSDNFQTTTSVSQVNEGQITTYPYDVNTPGFISDNRTANSMAVATTHFQYYQLNMNSADTVVWYSLKYGETYSLFNDVMNSYYIYSKGNVTYSGAGHTSDTSSVNSNITEAKLFVNTMIAAYRVACVPPKVSFSDATGKIAIENCLIPGDSDGVLDVKNSTDTSRNIYFVVNDSNMVANKTVTASFTYTYKIDNNTDTKDDDTVSGTISILVYPAQGIDSIDSNESLVSGVTYYVKMSDVWSNIPKEGQDTIDKGIRISVTAKTDFPGAPDLSNTASLTLRKLMLFSLS